MRVLLALKLTSDSLMVAEAIALRIAPGAQKICLLTDKNYGTTVDGVEYYFLNKSIAKIPFLRLIARIPKMINICKKEKIDFLICYHLTSYGFVGFIVSVLLRISLSVHFLGKDIDELCHKPLLGAMLLEYASTIDILTVQGSNSKKFLETKGLRRIHIIPTGCDLRKFQPVNDIKKDFDLIFVGRLGTEKRIDRFVDIVNIIRDKGINVTAVVVGTGPEEKRLLALIAKLDLRQHINYVGWTNNVSGYLERSRIFLLTSDSDQLPSALIEAMAMGLVPVASNVGNVSDVVTPDNGFLIERNDTVAFADVTISLLKDSNTYNRMSEQARRKAREFSLEANSERWGGCATCFNC